MSSPAPPLLAPGVLAVLAWTSKGMTADQIGNRLDRAASTVRQYQRQARISLDVPNMPAAVEAAYRHQLLPLPPAPPTAPAITGREWVFLRILATGQRFADMAVALDVSVSTIRCLAQQTYQRLGASTGSHAVGIAHRMRLMDVCPTCHTTYDQRGEPISDGQRGSDEP